MRIRCLVLAAIAACAMLSTQSTASVVVSTTRFVHEGDAREVVVRMTNKRTGPALVEAWVERADVAAQGQAPAFVPTPPLFRIESGRGQVVRLQRTQAPLPADRETLFWLHMLDVPPNPVGPADGRVKIALRSRLKVFHRPAGLPGSAAQAPDRLRWAFQASASGTPALRIDNPTPFHVTIARIGEDALAMRGEMVAPFGQLVLPLDGASAATDAATTLPSDVAHARRTAWQSGKPLRFESINDAGGADVRTARLALATP